MSEMAAQESISGLVVLSCIYSDCGAVCDMSYGNGIIAG